MSKSTMRRSDIQVMRGLAVTAVILYHSESSWFPNGYLGVDVFFVISGFVITPRILQIFDSPDASVQLRALGKFFKKRYFRLAPALAVVLCTSTVLIFFLAPPVDFQRYGRQGVATLLLIGNFGAYRYAGNYFSPSPNPLIHMWSLSVEEQIYIFLPVTLVCIFSMVKKFRISTNTLFIYSLFAFGSILAFLYPNEFYKLLLMPFSRAMPLGNNGFSFYSPLSRLWEFLLGGICFLISSEMVKRGFHQRILALPKFGIVSVITIILFSPLSIANVIGTLLVTLTSAFTFIAKSPAKSNRLSAVFSWLGDRSYSCYLIHMPLLYIASYSGATSIGTSSNRLLQKFLAILATLLFAHLTFKGVEVKFQRYGRSRIAKRRIAAMLAFFFLLPSLTFIAIDALGRTMYGLPEAATSPGWDFKSPCIVYGVASHPCSLGDLESKATVLLIGDSHAGDLSYALSQSAKADGWKLDVWTLAGCEVRFETSSKNSQTDCSKQNAQIYNWVHENRPHLIIVSERITEVGELQSFEIGLLKLHQLVSNMVLVANTPVFPDNQTFGVFRPIIMNLIKGPSPKVVAANRMDIRDKKPSDELINWASTVRIHTLNINSLFCTRSLCSRYENHHWLFVDSEHLSRFGAEKSVKIFSQMLDRYGLALPN